MLKPIPSPTSSESNGGRAHRVRPPAVMCGNSLTVKPELRHLADPIQLDKHFSPQWYAELWGVSPDTVVRWFQDKPGVLKLSKPGRAGRSRVELRIPFSIAMQVYEERSR